MVAAASFIKIISLSLRDHLIIMSVCFGSFLNHLPKDDSGQLGLITICCFFQINSLNLWKIKWFITFVSFHKVQNNLMWRILILDKKSTVDLTYGFGYIFWPKLFGLSNYLPFRAILICKNVMRKAQIVHKK